MIVAKLPAAEGKQYWVIRPSTGAEDTNPSISQSPAFGVYARENKLVVLWFEAVFSGPPGPYESIVEGEFWVDARVGEISEADRNTLLSLPHFTPPTASRFAEWRAYLDWREKVTEDNSKHRYSYSEWKLSDDRSLVRFFLSELQPVDVLKVRFQGQQLRALPPGAEPTSVVTSEKRRQSTQGEGNVGAFQRVVAIGPARHRQAGTGPWRYRSENKQMDGPAPHREKVAVDVRLSDDQRRKLREPEGPGIFPDEGELTVDVSGELATLRNQRQAIDRLEQGKALSAHLGAWLFNSQKARVPTEAVSIEILDPRFNDEQRLAVGKAMNAPDAAFLQGPPGTGKTTVIAELCRQTVKERKRTLIASQANLAVDNALGSLDSSARPSPELRPLRLMNDKREGDMEGSFKRFLPRNVLPHWLGIVAKACSLPSDAAAESGEDERWLKLRGEWADRIGSRRPADNTEAMQKLYARHANVIGATCNRSGSKDFYQSVEIDPAFDLVIVDEVSKATPPELLMPLLLGSRTVLVGDHRQLPPMFRADSFYEAVANDDLKEADLKRFEKLVTTSLFEELFVSAPDQLRHTLRDQYRMHPHIMDAVNHFYPDSKGAGILRAGTGREQLHREKQHGLSVNGHGNPLLIRINDHVLWLDSSLDEFGREVNEGEKRGTSRWNPHEVDLIADLLHHLDQTLAGKRDRREKRLDVGVISFYLAQKIELHERLTRGVQWQHLDVQVNTVDQFQGRECSIVIVSLVRSGEVSGEFVKDYRRINVAFSRAKNLLVIVGSRRAFQSAMVPIAPVTGGDPKLVKVYHEIANSVAQRGGARNATHVREKRHR